MATIFTKIINGEIPCYKIYEDEYTFAFLDIYPVQPGHILIVPKIEVDYFVDVPEPYYSAVFQSAKKISSALQKATWCVRVATMILGYEVPHFHYHLIPSSSLSDVIFAQKVPVTQDDLVSMQQKITSFL